MRQLTLSFLIFALCSVLISNPSMPMFSLILYGVRLLEMTLTIGDNWSRCFIAICPRHPRAGPGPPGAERPLGGPFHCRIGTTR
jgi:hypothetical protein